MLNIFKGRMWVLITFGVVIIMLFFGLRPKGLMLNNNVRWLHDRNGISIGRYGVAYTKMGDALDVIDESQGFTIELSVRPISMSRNRFMVIAMFYGDSDETQLIIGQWRSSIVVINGRDYENKHHTSKIIASNILRSDEVNRLTIRSDKAAGTAIFYNGVRISFNHDLVLTIPKGTQETYLAVGNSVYNQHTWIGEIYGLSLFSAPLPDISITSLHSLGYETKGIIAQKHLNPLILYAFDDNQGFSAKDYGNGNLPLVIPQRVTILKKRFLAARWDQLVPTKSEVLDIILNFFGFIPLGFLVVAPMCCSIATKRYKLILIPLVMSFGLSLFIETAQVWMPSRSSSLFDLFLNTIGGGIGGGMGYVVHILWLKDRNIFKFHNFLFFAVGVIGGLDSAHSSLK